MLASIGPVFGVMKFEVDPLTFDNWRRLAWLGIDWLQDAGGFAMLGLVLWIVNGYLNPVYDVLPNGKRRNRLVSRGMLASAAVAGCIYLVGVGLIYIVSGEHASTQKIVFLGKSITKMYRALEITMAAAGLAAIIGFGGPFLMDCLRMRWGRIYALAKLSFKEAVRRRVVWVFLSILILYLFPARWFFQEKPEDELKSIVGVTTRGMNVLLVSVGLLLAAFSIPTDIKNLTIHTIVTKPVERFEIILGRFFGYLGLVTAALLVMTCFGLILINAGNVSPEAAEESMKSRAARYGEMEFRSKRESDFKGVDVGREYQYRRYIAGGSSQRAIWNFGSLPDKFQSMESVPLEFAFDIYRTNKGEEGTGIQISFEIVTHSWNPTKRIDDPQNPGNQITMQDAYDRDTKGAGNAQPGSANWEKVNKAARNYGRYIYRNWQIFDYHTTSISVPPGLFQNAAEGTPDRESLIQGPAGAPARRLQIQLRCESLGQFVGTAKHDLYFLESEGSFSLNYFKGAVGLWYRLVIALAIAIALSTYFAGVLSFLFAMFLFIGGFFLDFISELAKGLNIGGGPLESFDRLVRNQTATIELDPTPTVRTLQVFDGAFRWLARRLIHVIPDVDRYGFTEYVSQGFSIGPDVLVVNLITLVGYVVPWLVASYYLMRAREIAA